MEGSQQYLNITITGRSAIMKISPVLKGLIVMNLINEAGEEYYLGKILIE
jgi:hypothetical protein